MNLIEEATAKIKENPNPQEAMKVMAETSKNIDKCCEENGITLSDWKKNLSDDLKKNTKKQLLNSWKLAKNKITFK